jgi:hypothetical protein
MRILQEGEMSALKIQWKKFDKKNPPPGDTYLLIKTNTEIVAGKFHFYGKDYDELQVGHRIIRSQKAIVGWCEIDVEDK